MSTAYTSLTTKDNLKTPHLVLHAERSPFNKKRGIEDEDYKKAQKLFIRVSSKAESKSFNDFVGFLCSKEHTYICLPKVFHDQLCQISSDEPLDEPTYQQWLTRAHLLRRALLRYEREQRGAKSAQKSVELLEAYLPDRKRPDLEQPVSHLALAQLILDDYRQHGLWRDSQHTYQRDGSGPIHWARTISRGGELLLPQRGGVAPMYPAPITRQRQHSHDHPLTLAQLAVLHDLQALYGPILSEGPLHLPPISMLLKSHKGLPALGQQLKRSLSQLFEQRSRRLADLLIRYIELDDRGRKDQVDVFGTTSFHTLFEHMCVKVLNADPKQLLKGDFSKVEWSFNSALKKLINEHEVIREGSDQRLDLLTSVDLKVQEEAQSDVEHEVDSKNYALYELKGEKGKKLLVLDAKYYDVIGALKYSKNAVSDLPKMEDIRKQYAYAAWLKKRLDYKEVLNGLIFPTFGLEGFHSDEIKMNPDLQVALTSEPFEQLGSVKMGNFAPIPVFGINIDLLMRDYADGRRYTEVKMSALEERT